MTETLNITQTPRLNPMFRLQWEQAQAGYVLLYPEGMVKLNGPAGEILSRVDSECSIQQICDQLQAKFPDAEAIQADILEFLQQALEQRWISV